MSTTTTSLATTFTQLDFFPKIPTTYKSRSESRGFFTVFVCFVTLLLVLNDIGEYIWGWPDYEFSIDDNKQSYLNINLDVTVNMPCRYLSVDLRDAIGDRLMLSGGFRRDGTKFDIGQATTLKEHAEALSASQALSQSRSSRGFFSTLFRSSKPSFKPSYKHKEDSDSCRIFGTLMVKRVTANLHITTLGHGYSSYEHVDHSMMNLSHIISEFSFGPFFPEMVQPLDNSFEVTTEPFVAYQYFLHVVPTTYIAPRSTPLHTHQYSVTHYTRVMEHNRGTPGIFFKFDIEPLSITIHQRTTSLLQLFIRVVGVIGGVFVCVGYGLRVSRKVGEVVSGKDKQEGLVAAQASGARVGLRAKWSGAELRSRNKTGVSAPSSPWYDTGSGAGRPQMQSPYLPSPSVFASQMGTPAFGPGPGSGMFSPAVNAGSPATPLTAGGMLSVPSSPMVNGAAPGVNGNGGGYVAEGGHGHNGHAAPPRRSVVSPKKDD
ncbi:endoplasmic reticulum vesicle transporter-domain-containing protein [Cyathus striatus]|nr:endoplasmic reticulum vesicle transporter-domain-containing protein [Cyathus striatus]